MGLLKKDTSGVFANLRCSRTGRTLRVWNCLWPCWLDFFEQTKVLSNRDPHGQIGLSCFVMVNTHRMRTEMAQIRFDGIGNRWILSMKDYEVSYS